MLIVRAWIKGAGQVCHGLPSVRVLLGYILPTYRGVVWVLSSVSDWAPPFGDFRRDCRTEDGGRGGLPSVGGGVVLRVLQEAEGWLSLDHACALPNYAGQQAQRCAIK